MSARGAARSSYVINTAAKQLGEDGAILVNSGGGEEPYADLNAEPEEPPPAQIKTSA